jgi:Flp pilus assembly protein TadD
LLRFGEWDAVLQEGKPKDSQKVSMALWHYSRALAYAARGDKSTAARERSDFEAARKAIPADAAWGQNKTADVLAMVSEILGAKLGEDPVGRLRRAVAMQDAFVYDEPPAWYYPVRESLGAALLRAGQAAEAEKVFRDGVRRSPKNGRMLFGLMEALKAQGKSEEAGWVQKEFEAAWAKADVRVRLEEM